ncbi:MAG: UDP-N-acetylmuramate dehydrogenase [Chloroflexaceae bacterium]|nr:UDP-N-acetylmuramate dehydrogenase [Chloroflexaceae bacterium]
MITTNLPSSGALLVKRTDEPLSRHTSLRIGGPARYYLEVDSQEGLQVARVWAAEQQLPWFVLGGGTNVLIRDTGFAGVVVRYRDTTSHLTATDDTACLYLGAGAPMAGTARRLAGAGWAGLEWAEGLPGTLGGAVCGNAGCYGGDMAGVVQRVWLLVADAVQIWTVEQMAYAYRYSVLKTAPWKGQAVVLAAEIALRRDEPQALAETMNRIAAERKSKMGVGSSCGSVFKNPTNMGQPGLSAGRLIDEAGLKGTRIGAAEISQRHANYIINLGGASSDDVLRLIDRMRTAVVRQFGIELELEVEIVG